MSPTSQSDPSRAGEASPEKFACDVCPALETQVVAARPAHVNVLLRLSTMTGLQMNISATLTMLCDYAAEMIHYDSALAYFWKSTEERPLLRTAVRIPSATRDKLVEGNILDFWARQFGRPLVVTKGERKDADLILDLMEAESALVVPSVVANRAMGSLQFFSRRAAAFSPEDVQLIWMLSRISENLLAREQTNEGLLQFAFTDHLTGLRTRGYFEQQLELEIKRSERKGEGFVLLMLDIDHFKPLNDTFGHHVGDQVLRKVASILTQDMREVDTVARYGGEEFVIILPETTEESGVRVAQRIRAAVEAAKYFPDTLKPEQPLTISIGVAVFGKDSKAKRELVEFADAALYYAKSQGRNRVVRYADLAQQSNKKIS